MQRSRKSNRPKQETGEREEEASGKAKGGYARKDALSPERRLEIAKKAAAARWSAGKPLRATHKGNFEQEFGIDVDCFVLDDEQKTAVISKRGMATTLGFGDNSSFLMLFLGGKKVAPYVTKELAEKMANPLIFQWQPPQKKAVAQALELAHGYDVTVLIDLCKLIIAVGNDGKLLDKQKRLVTQAHIILNASAKAGIKGLVYALAGYDQTRAEVIAAFKFFVREEARDYEKEFPDQLYSEWYRLYKLPKPERNKPWKFRTLTLNHVYTPLARSNGKILELTRAKRATKGDRWAKLHQFLSEIGVKALRTHLGQLLGIAQVSEDQVQYERHVEKIFGQQVSFDLATKTKTSDSEPK